MYMYIHRVLHISGCGATNKEKVLLDLKLDKPWGLLEKISGKSRIILLVCQPMGQTVRFFFFRKF